MVTFPQVQGGYRLDLSSESCRNTPETGMILYFSTQGDHNWCGEAKIRAIVVAEDWSQEGVGILWDTDGRQKGPGRGGPNLQQVP